jgi:hypothetical protein
MTPTKPKPREWWIPYYIGGTKERPCKVHTQVLCSVDLCDFHECHTHVIEYSAIKQLQDALYEAGQALAMYGEHDLGCPASQAPVGPTPPCSCGYDEALQKLDEWQKI